MRIATLGGRTFVAVTERIYMIRAGGATTAQAVRFGVGTSADIGGSPNFLGQGITEMRVFRQVSVSGFLMDLLVVTTVPMVGGSDQQGAKLLRPGVGMAVPNVGPQETARHEASRTLSR